VSEVITTTRVRYPEVDRMSVAHHAVYPVWFEMGRTELMREAGAPYGELEDEQGLLFPVVELGVRFRAPARYDDELEIGTRLAELAGAHVRFHYRIVRRGSPALLAEGFTVHGAVGGNGRPRRIPVALRERLEPFSASEEVR
jgi:acyl-CoA thioester hydrolase